MKNKPFVFPRLIGPGNDSYITLLLTHSTYIHSAHVVTSCQVVISTNSDCYGSFHQWGHVGYRPSLLVSCKRCSWLLNRFPNHLHRTGAGVSVVGNLLVWRDSRQEELHCSIYCMLLHIIKFNLYCLVQLNHWIKLIKFACLGSDGSGMRCWGPSKCQQLCSLIANEGRVLKWQYATIRNNLLIRNYSPQVLVLAC